MATSASCTFTGGLSTVVETRQRRTHLHLQQANYVPQASPPVAKVTLLRRRDAAAQHLLQASVGPARSHGRSTAAKHTKTVCADAATQDRLKLLGKESKEGLQGASICLVGMMGSGKSTVGRVVAEALGYAFFDSDQVVEQAAGASVAQIFEENGEEDFRALESKVLMELCAYKNLVVSTGGGAVMSNRNWSHMQSGIVVWLDVPTNVLAERVDADESKRPLVDGEGSTLEQLNAIKKERLKMYQQSDIVIKFSGSDDVALADVELAAERVLLEVKGRVAEDAQAEKLRTDPRNDELKGVNINKVDEEEEPNAPW